MNKISTKYQQRPYQDGSPSNGSFVLPFKGTNPGGLRQPPPLDDTTHVLILLVVLIPILFTLIFCVITYCIYRYRKSKSNRSSTDTSNIDQSHPPLATIIYNTQHSPYIYEESPPAYDSLQDIKKDPNELIQLTILPNSTQDVTVEAPVIQPSAPVSPTYSN